MDWVERMNGAVSYIEDNLVNDIDYKKAANIACCSVYHFQRMFSFITGIPLAEYIRRRRLTLAAFELQNSNVRIIDLALKYGYDSPNSFTRAFQFLHGVTPSNARDMGVKLKAYPRMSFYISVKGDVEMNYRIEEKLGFTVFGVSAKVNAVNGECFRQIPKFWDDCIRNGTMENILKVAGSKEGLTINGDICGNHEMLINAALYGHNPNDGTFRYMVCQKKPAGKIPNSYEILNIPKMTWAIFPTEEITQEKVTEVVQNIWKRVGSEWFPTSGYEHAECAEFEMYYCAKDDKFITEVWIPVVKK